MKRIVRLTESDLVKLVKRVMAEQVSELPTFGSTGDVYAPEDQSLASDIVKKKINIVRLQNMVMIHHNKHWIVFKINFLQINIFNPFIFS